jgi:hypothetical protein
MRIAELLNAGSASRGAIEDWRTSAIKIIAAYLIRESNSAIP